MSEPDIAIVTGSARGIGEAVCVRLAERGATVFGLDVAHDNSPPLPAKTDLGAQIVPIRCDVGRRPEVQDVIGTIHDSYGYIGTVVNNAAWIHYTSIEEVDEPTFDRMLDIGVKSIMWTTQAVLTSMTSGGGGAIVNVTSIAARTGIKGATMYGAFKGAADSLTRHLAIELADRGIRVNAVAPGPVITPGFSAVVDDEGIRRREARSPLGMASPDDVARAVEYLASRDASAVTGHTLVIDGGMTVSM